MVGIIGNLKGIEEELVDTSLMSSAGGYNRPGRFVFVQRNGVSALDFLGGQFVDDRFVDLLWREKLTLATR